MPLEVLRDGGAIVGARLTAPRFLQRGDDVADGIIAAACSIAPTTSRLGITCRASPRAARPLSSPRSRRGGRWKRRSRAATSSRRHFPVDGATGIHLYLRDGDEVDIRSRMFAPLHGGQRGSGDRQRQCRARRAPREPRPEPDLSLRLRIAQGVEMGRPSLMEASAEKRGGAVIETRIGGRCVPVMSGTIEV